jgi:hypothetical protein
MIQVFMFMFREREREIRREIELTERERERVRSAHHPWRPCYCVALQTKTIDAAATVTHRLGSPLYSPRSTTGETSLACYMYMVQQRSQRQQQHPNHHSVQKRCMPTAGLIKVSCLQPFCFSNATDVPIYNKCI